MPDLSTPYTVTLRDDLPATERDLLRRYCHELHGSDGSTLLQLLCTRVDPSHPHYLELDALLPRRQGSCRLRLPHALVFLIDGDGEARAGTPHLAQDNSSLQAPPRHDD